MTTLSDSQIAGYAAGAGFTPAQIPTMVAIALAESSGNTDAVHHNMNGTTDEGIWQINSVHKFTGNLFDPKVNAAAARTVFNQQGFQAWSTYNSGAYTRYLGRAKSAAGSSGAAPTTNGVSGSSDLGNSVSNATNGKTWLRMGEFSLGAILVIFAILRVTGGDKMLIEGAKVAALA